MTVDGVQRRMAAILVADVVGYSRLMGAKEVATLAALKALRKELIEVKIAEHEGRVVKLTGDGMLVEFPSVVNAVACAAEIQRRMQERNREVPAEQRIEFRVGVNVGDVIVEGDDIYGDGINVATRLESLAPAGGIAISAIVRDHIGNRLDLSFEDTGEHMLKNIDRPIRIYRVGLTPPDGPTWNSVAAPRQSERQRPSIAVLPFVNMSDDPGQEYFADGMTEDIITDLSKISGLSVIARNSVFAYKGRPADVQEVSRRFKVRTVLEGSVRRAGQRVRVNAQLIDGNDGTHIWADRYDRNLTDIFAIQDEITHAIIEQLKIRLLPEERDMINAAATENIEAYTYYLRGRHFFHMRTKSHTLLARRMFAKAAELDPLYARAYAGIASCDSVLCVHHDVNIALDDILATSAKALQLDPRLAEAHSARGLALYNCQRNAEAMAEFEQALALDPTLFEAHHDYAWFWLTQGDFEKAAQYSERAAELMPADWKSLLMLRQAQSILGRLADVTTTARRMLERAEQVLEQHPESSSAAYVGAIGLVDLGDPNRAREWASRALAIDPDDPAVHYNVACVYSLIGDVDQSIDLLERLVPRLSYQRKALMSTDPDLDPLRNHPRFRALLPVAT